MPLSVGDRLGPYEIVAPIGAGGMGEVYKARDTRLDRIVAIKVAREQFSERFEREARAVAALNHPHICQLYDVGPNYLVMEFVDGTPLTGPLPLEKAVEYAGQILDALDAAHRKGITHRDLKPANILVTKQGIKLLDFGLAKQRAPLTEADAGVGGDRADVTGPAHTFNSSDRSAKIQKFFDTSVFALPALGTFGTSSRNFLFGPGIENFDAAVFKRFAITEKKQFELRWEVFNSLNRPNFFNPVGAFTNPLIGRLTSARDPRIMQVALKFYF